MFLIEYVYLNWYFLGLVQTLVEWSDIEKQFVATFYSWVCKGLFFCQILVGIFFSFVHLSHFTWDFLYFYSFAIFNYGFSSGLFFLPHFYLEFSSALFICHILLGIFFSLICHILLVIFSALFNCHILRVIFFSFVNLPQIYLRFFQLFYLPPFTWEFLQFTCHILLRIFDSFICHILLWTSQSSFHMSQTVNEFERDIFHFYRRIQER